jgi:hypothetical protein
LDENFLTDFSNTFFDNEIFEKIELEINGYKKQKRCGLSPQVNYTNQVTTAFWLS